MTELRQLLDLAAGDPPTPSPDVVASDVRRGRRALRLRRARVGAAGLVAIALLGAAGLSLADPTQDRLTAVTPASDPPNPGVDLVAYGGPLGGARLQPAEIPDGWSVSGDAYHLLVSPPDNRSPDFRGSIVVYVDKGIPREPLPKDAEVPVGERTGYAIRTDPSGLQVWVPLLNGIALRAQASPDTGWDEATLGRFLGGVSVLDGAKATTG
jgi:hypothetical protein